MRIFVLYCDDNGNQLGANIERPDDFDFGGEGSMEALIAALPDVNTASGFFAFRPVDDDDAFPTVLDYDGNEVAYAAYDLPEEENAEAEGEVEPDGDDTEA